MTEFSSQIILLKYLCLSTYLVRVSKPIIVSRVSDANLPNRVFRTDPALPECPQLKFVRVDGSLFFLVPLITFKTV